MPREAVIDTGTRQIAVVASGGGRFEPRQVKLGVSGRDGLVQVLSGLAPNEQVVIALATEAATIREDRIRASRAERLLHRMTGSRAIAWKRSPMIAR